MGTIFFKQSLILALSLFGLSGLFFSFASQAADWQKIDLLQPSANVLQGRSLLKCELQSFPKAQRLFYGCRIGVDGPATKSKPYDYWVAELDNQGKKKQEWTIKNISNGANLFSASIIAADNQDFYLAVTEIDHSANDAKAQTLSNWLIKILKIYRLSKNNKQEAIDYGQVMGGFDTLPAVMVTPPGNRPACLWIAINRPAEDSKNLDNSLFEIVEQCHDRKGKERLRSIIEWKTDAKKGWYELSFISSDGITTQIGAKKLEIGKGKAIYQTALKLWHFGLSEDNRTIWENMTYQAAGMREYIYANAVLPNDTYGLRDYFLSNGQNTQDQRTSIIIPNIADKSAELLIRQQPKGGAQPVSKVEWPITGKIDIAKLMADRWQKGGNYSWNAFLINRFDKGWIFLVFQVDKNKTGTLKTENGYIHTFLLKPDGGLLENLPIRVLGSGGKEEYSWAKVVSGLNEQTIFLLLTETTQSEKFSLWQLKLN